MSVGAYDVVKEVLSQLGTVAVRPARHAARDAAGLRHHRAGQTPIFTLPGNPVSAYVSFEMFVRPVIRTLLDQEPIQRATVKAMCTEGVFLATGETAVCEGKAGSVRRLGRGQAGRRPRLTPGLRNLAQANALIVVPEEVVEVSPATRST